MRSADPAVRAFPAYLARGRLRSFGAVSMLLAVLLGITACASGEEVDAGDPPADDQAYEEFLESRAAFLGIADPPEVSLERWVMPEEVPALVDACLLESGYEQVDGSWYAPEAQRPAFLLANYECMAKYPPLPKYTQEWTDAQIEVQYEWTVDHVVPCLEAHGYEIGQVPSKQAFIDTYSTDPFFPFAQVPSGLGNAERSELEKACPQIAPSKTLFE